MLSSLLEKAGPAAGVDLEGKATIDVRHYRVRGRFTLRVDPDQNVFFAFVSSSAVGTHREDVVVSFYDDTLRVFDRERGRLYVGDGVDSLAADDGQGVWNLAEILRRIVSTAPRCGRLSALDVSGRVRGRLDGSRFEIDRDDDGRVRSAKWPVRAPGPPDEQIVVRYSWSGSGTNAALSGLEARFESRGWRVRLTGR